VGFGFPSSHRPPINHQTQKEWSFSASSVRRGPKDSLLPDVGVGTRARSSRRLLGSASRTLNPGWDHRSFPLPENPAMSTELRKA
jgi:hypothetical protein